MISEYLEDIFAPLGRKAGISGADMSLIYTPQIVASLVDVPVNLLMTDLGSRLFNAIAGIASAAVVATGHVKGKAAAEVSEMASYWLTSLYVPSPHSPKIAQQVVSFVNGLTSGNFQTALNAIWKGPSYAQNELIAYTGMLNPVSYQSGVNTPLVNQSSTAVTSTTSTSSTSAATRTSSVKISSAVSMADPIPRTPNQRALSLLSGS